MSAIITSVEDNIFESQINMHVDEQSMEIHWKRYVDDETLIFIKETILHKFNIVRVYRTAARRVILSKVARVQSVFVKASLEKCTRSQNAFDAHVCSCTALALWLALGIASQRSRKLGTAGVNIQRTHCGISSEVERERRAYYLQIGISREPRA